jgi:hypothetical protein
LLDEGSLPLHPLLPVHLIVGLWPQICLKEKMMIELS